MCIQFVFVNIHVPSHHYISRIRGHQVSTVCSPSNKSEGLDTNQTLLSAGEPKVVVGRQCRLVVSWRQAQHTGARYSFHPQYFERTLSYQSTYEGLQKKNKVTSFSLIVAKKIAEHDSTTHHAALASLKSDAKPGHMYKDKNFT